MAREMILVPKLKYERLLENNELNKEPVKQDTVDNDEDKKQMSDNTSTDTTMSYSINDTSQTGNGYVSRSKTIGKPPGVSMKRRKKRIPWLTY
jgi:capsid portal protein